MAGLNWKYGGVAMSAALCATGVLASVISGASLRGEMGVFPLGSQACNRSPPPR